MNHSRISFFSAYLCNIICTCIGIITPPFSDEPDKDIQALSSFRKKEYCGHRILVNSVTENPFSFFGWIFIPGDCLKDEESGNIIIHEGIHASQYHSADNILVELTAALMWFNPIVWMMKRSVHLLHEYLADEGTLGRGIDRLRYQSLLLNQVAEGSLISLSSSFNNSLKKE